MSRELINNEPHIVKKDDWGPWGNNDDSSPSKPEKKSPSVKKPENLFSYRRRNSSNGGGNNGGDNFSFDFAQNKKMIVFSILIAFGLWAASGFYMLNPDEEGIVQHFGKYDRTEGSGFHYHLPWPFETLTKLPVTHIHRVDIGIMKNNKPSFKSDRLSKEENLMLTGDENIVEASFSVFWLIEDSKYFLFKVREPKKTIKAAAESVIRDVIGQTPISVILTEGRGKIEQDIKAKLQDLMADYETGVLITQVQLQAANPPEQVLAAYRDVQAAKADQERIKNEAERYRNKVVPEARGEAAKIEQEAISYKERAIAKAEGDAKRFEQVLEAYKLNPDFYKKRKHLETMEAVLKGKSKILIDPSIANKGGAGLVPYLPLDKLIKK